MQRALREEFTRTVMSRAFAFINARLAARGGEGFAAGEHLSIADLCVASLCSLIEAGNFEFVPTDFCSRFTAMSALLGRIRVSQSVSQSFVHAPIPDTLYAHFAMYHRH
jgi:glutathione S-transferase